MTFDEEIKEFSKSQAFIDILGIARQLSFNTRDEKQLIQPLAQLTINAIKAIENKSIVFEDETSKKDLQKLLAITLKRVSIDQETMH